MVKFTGLAISILTGLVSPAAAQWLDYPTPGIPRTADGKPNLSAPTPRSADGKPDLSGMWRVKPATAGETDKAMQSGKAQPWAQELSDSARLVHRRAST